MNLNHKGKKMCKVSFYLICFLTISVICHADNTQGNINDISKLNNQIIKAVHSSGGLIFATPPYWGRKNTQAGFKQLVKYLGHTIDKNVTLVVLKDYESMVTRTMAGEVDLGFYGSSLYVKSKKKFPGLKYLATSVFKATGKPSYYSYLITKKGTGLKSIQSLEKKSFAFGSKESTGGYRYPMAWMIENNLEPENYFKSVKFLGSHNRILDAVANGEIDAGAVSPGPLNKKTAQYGHVYNRIRKFGPIPGSVVAASDEIPDKTIKRIVTALELLPTAVADVKEANYIGFKVLSDESYDQFRKVIKLTD